MFGESTDIYDIRLVLLIEKSLGCGMTDYGTTIKVRRQR